MPQSLTRSNTTSIIVDDSLVIPGTISIYVVTIHRDGVDATPQLDTRQEEDKTYVKQPLIDRNRGVANRHGIPFEFTIKLPKPRKARTITKRDELGRIIWTKAK